MLKKRFQDRKRELEAALSAVDQGLQSLEESPRASISSSTGLVGGSGGISSVVKIDGEDCVQRLCCLQLSTPAAIILRLTFVVRRPNNSVSNNSPFATCAV